MLNDALNSLKKGHPLGLYSSQTAFFVAFGRSLEIPDSFQIFGPLRH